MKSLRLFKEIGQIDDALIYEAETIQTHFGFYLKYPWAKGLIPAAALLLLFISVLFLKWPSKKLPDELPLLSVSLNISEGMGFEGCMAFSIDELENGNPWTENMSLSTLPVFKNPLQNGGLNEKEMFDTATSFAKALGLEILDRNLQTPVENSPEYNMAALTCEGIRIETNTSGETTIWFDPAIQIPDFTGNPAQINTRSQALSVLNILMEKYPPIHQMDDPKEKLFGDYNIFAQRNFILSAYESGDDPVTQILGFNFNTVTFSLDEQGKLFIIRRFKQDLSQKLGDYPIISTEKAKQLLLNGHFITTVYEDMPAEDRIGSMELVYRTGRFEEVFMPYYRFWIELPSMEQENGLQTFGAYYVPAVEEQYLTELPLWDGSFN